MVRPRRTPHADAALTGGRVMHHPLYCRLFHRPLVTLTEQDAPKPAYSWLWGPMARLRVIYTCRGGFTWVRRDHGV